MILVTKVKNEFKELPMSKGFGYVCFVEQESAKKAKEEMNNTFIPGFETAKRPLLIDFFMPKYERKQMLTRLQQYYPNKQLPIMNPYGNAFGLPMNFPPNLAKHVKPQNMIHHQNQYVKPKPQDTNSLPNNLNVVNRTDDPDVKYLRSLEDDSAKKDYLGEFIFKKIENHPLAQNYNFTIDTIGKITGMILGIEDINEIADIALNHENLSARISEALNLLNAQG